MFKRFIEVFICIPIFIICILLNIVFVASSILWGPIYYIITGNDPLCEDIIVFFYNVGENITDFIDRKL